MTKKLISLLLALTMVFASVVPVAADDPNPNAAVRIQEFSYQDVIDPDITDDTGIPDVPSTGIDVHLAIRSHLINAAGIDRDYFTVHLDPSDCTTVYDAHNNAHSICYLNNVISVAAADNSWLSVNCSLENIPTGQALYVSGVSDSNVANGMFFVPLVYSGTARPKNGTNIGPTRLNSYNGWMFQVNNQFIQLHASDYPDPQDYDPSIYGPLGTSLEQTYIFDGDYIDLNFCNANYAIDSTNWTRITDVVYDSSQHTLSFTVQVAGNYYDNTNHDWWIVSDYEPMESTPLTVYIDNISPGYSVTTNTDGEATITNINLSNGSHTIYIPAGYVTYYTKKIGSITYYYQLPYTTTKTAPFTVPSN